MLNKGPKQHLLPRAKKRKWFSLFFTFGARRPKETIHKSDNRERPPLWLGFLFPFFWMPFFNCGSWKRKGISNSCPYSFCFHKKARAKPGLPDEKRGSDSLKGSYRNLVTKVFWRDFCWSLAPKNSAREPFCHFFLGLRKSRLSKKPLSPYVSFPWYFRIGNSSTRAQKVQWNLERVYFPNLWLLKNGR